MFAIFCCTKWCFQRIIWKLKSMIATNLFDPSVVCYCELLDGSRYTLKIQGLVRLCAQGNIWSTSTHSVSRFALCVLFMVGILFVTISRLICGVISSDFWLELLPKIVHLLLMNVLMFTAIKLHLSWSILSWFNG